ncbi:MAG: enoyl-CoA hydratase/isomerase family protein [Deltaproteobacteria bacterium]|nr:enoyl-CoA hydratase/isomerase family protein [Deltaproteobacteria bacterium]
MTFSSNVLSIECKGPVGTLWLDRPEKRNAMNQEMWTALPSAITELGNNPDIRVVIIAGRGKSFCVGLDISSAGESQDQSPPPSGAIANLRQFEITRSFQDGITAIANCPVPVIAAVHSHCIGAGIDLITACNIRLASADSIFSVRETRIGIVADVGTLQRLPDIVSAGHVAELAYTGKDFDAAHAEKIGLVNNVYPDVEAVQAAALKLASEIAANPPLAVRGTKFILQQSENLTKEQSLLLNGLWTMATSLNSNDFIEAIGAFMEKRAPKFTGT